MLMKKKIVLATAATMLAGFGAAEAATLNVTGFTFTSWATGNPFVPCGTTVAATCAKNIIDQSAAGTIGGSIVTDGAGNMVSGTLTWTGTLKITDKQGTGTNNALRDESYGLLTNGSLDLVTGHFTAAGYTCTNITYASNDTDLCTPATDSPLGPFNHTADVLSYWDLSDYGLTDPGGTAMVGTNLVTNPPAPTTPGGLYAQSHSGSSYALQLFDNSGNTLGWGGYFAPKTGLLKLSIATTAVAAVPVPAAFWLMGSGLAGLGIFGRRKKQLS